MTDRDFSFALECYDPGLAQEMLRDLVTQILSAAGCADHVEQTVSGIRSAGANDPGQRFGLQFVAKDAALSVVVSSGTQVVWHASFPIP